MRVLWLTQLQLPAATGDTTMALGGWHEGLRMALEEYEPGVELGIVSTGPVRHEPFRRGNATYFSLPSPRVDSRVQRLTAGWRGTTAIPSDAIEEAVSIARRFDPDVIHLHGTEHFLGLAALRLRAPCVATLQGIATICERYMLDTLPVSELGRSVATREFIRASSPFHAYVQMRARARVERQILGGLRYVMGQTRWDHDVVSLLNPSVVYFGCSRALQPAYYDAEWREPSSPEATIFCTSSPSPYKGIETLIEGVGLLVKAGHSGVRLRIAGDFPGSYLWPMLSRLVRRSGLEGVVTWLGPLEPSQIVHELSRASLFVLPSHIENESNALIEAMLVGVPSVAAAVGGVPSVVRDGVDAALYHDSDPFALAGAVARLLDDRAFARLLGANARERAHVRFDREAVAHRTREVYRLVLDAAAGDRAD